jgi:hypothetical protein
LRGQAPHLAPRGGAPLVEPLPPTLLFEQPESEEYGLSYAQFDAPFCDALKANPVQVQAEHQERLLQLQWRLRGEQGAAAVYVFLCALGALWLSYRAIGAATLSTGRWASLGFAAAAAGVGGVGGVGASVWRGGRLLLLRRKSAFLKGREALAQEVCATLLLAQKERAVRGTIEETIRGCFPSRTVVLETSELLPVGIVCQIAHRELQGAQQAFCDLRATFPDLRGRLHARVARVLRAQCLPWHVASLALEARIRGEESAVVLSSPSSSSSSPDGEVELARVGSSPPILLSVYLGLGGA